MGLFSVLPRVRGRAGVLAFLAAAGLGAAPAVASGASLKITPDATTYYVDAPKAMNDSTAVVSGTADNTNSYLTVYRQPASSGCANNDMAEANNPNALQADEGSPGYYHNNATVPAGPFSFHVGFSITAVGSYIYCAYLDGSQGSANASPSASATATAGPVSIVHSTTAYTNDFPGALAYLTQPSRLNSNFRAYVAFAGAVQPVRFGLTVTLSAASAKALHITTRKLQSTEMALPSRKCEQAPSLSAGPDGGRSGVTSCPLPLRAVSHADAVKITNALNHNKKITLTYDYAITLSSGKTRHDVETVKAPPSYSPEAFVLYGQFPFDYKRFGQGG